MWELPLNETTLLDCTVYEIFKVGHVTHSATSVTWQKALHKPVSPTLPSLINWPCPPNLSFWDEVQSDRWGLFENHPVPSWHGPRSVNSCLLIAAKNKSETSTWAWHQSELEASRCWFACFHIGLLHKWIRTGEDVTSLSCFVTHCVIQLHQQMPPGAMGEELELHCCEPAGFLSRIYWVDINPENED